MRLTRLIAAAGAALALAACSAEVKPGGDTAAAAAAQPMPAPPTPLPAPSPAPVAGADSPGASGAGGSAAMRIEVDLEARKAYVYRGGTASDTIPVAVGSRQWPTRPGEWTIRQVVFNPEWVPPDESWAEEREPRKPGDPKNPLGRAQLVYDPPRSIHGTNAPGSIGSATSHGSVRMRNEDILELARQVLAAGGAPKDDAWLRRAESNRSEKQIVELPRPVPIRVF